MPRIGWVIVNTLGLGLLVLIRLFELALIVRILIEMIQSFSRQFTAPRWFMVIAEAFFVVTDPPVKLARRVIPPLNLGAVALDMSVIVVFLLCMLLRMAVAVILL